MKQTEGKYMHQELFKASHLQYFELFTVKINFLGRFLSIYAINMKFSQIIQYSVWNTINL